MPSLFAEFVTRAAVRATRIFYEIGRAGPELPGGPLLVVANHPNSLMDALVILAVAGRRVRPLARAPLFDRPLFGHVLRGMGGLPVYRPQDDPNLTYRNETTFDAAVAALRAGEAVLIFPEGVSHSEPRVAPLRTGAARIALPAEDGTGWRLGLRILPVGLTYERKALFRGRVAVAIGTPFEVGPWRRAYERNPQEAVRQLTQAIADALERVAISLPSWEDWAIVSAAAEIFPREKGWVRAREPDAPAAKLILMQRFAEGLRWLRGADPERAERIAVAVRTYRRRVARLGVAEGDIPDAYDLAATLRYAFRSGAALLFLAPLAALGAMAWYLPFKAPPVAVWLLRPAYEAVATVKLVTGVLLFPLAYAIYLALGWRLGGWPALLGVAAALPALGAIALWWHARSEDLREDARVLWRALRRRGLQQQLLGRRRALVAEFEAVAAAWELEKKMREEPHPSVVPAGSVETSQ